MVRYVVTVKRMIPASAESVYNVLIDYRNGHPYVLPGEYFEDVKIMKGYGIGEGTRIQKVYHPSANIPLPNFLLGFWKKRYTMILDVTEPEPGRIIQEIDTGAYNIIRYIVDPIIIHDTNKNIEQVDDKDEDCNNINTTTQQSCTVTIDIRMLNSLGLFTGVIDMILKKYLCYKMYTATLEQLYQYMIQHSDTQEV